MIAKSARGVSFRRSFNGKYYTQFASGSKAAMLKAARALRELAREQGKRKATRVVAGAGRHFLFVR